MKLLYGEETYLINLNLQKMLQTKTMSPIYFSELNDLETIILEISTVSMFDNAKVLVIKNHPVLKIHSLSSQFLKATQHFLKNTELIFVLEETKLPDTSLVQLLKTYGEVHEYKKLTPRQIPTTIREIVSQHGGQISNKALFLLASKLPNHLAIIVQEVQKLILENPVITDEMVSISVGDYVLENYFALSNALMSLSKRDLISSYKEKFKAGVKPLMIIDQIGRNLCLAKNVDTYRNQGLSSKEISNKLKVHQFQVKKSLELISKTSTNFLDFLILNLAELDQKIKTGRIDEKIGLDVFLLKLIK